MAFSASFLHTTLLLLIAFILLPTTAFSRGVAVVANGTALHSPTASTTKAANNSDMYTCYLCLGRHSLMMKWCPIEKDACHIACLSADSSSRGTDGHGSLAHGPSNDGDDDCYVMKLYSDGSWVIVNMVSCRAVTGCYLVCSWGDSRGETTPAVARAPPLPLGLTEFQRCGYQLTAPAPDFSRARPHGARMHGV